MQIALERQYVQCKHTVTNSDSTVMRMSISVWLPMLLCLTIALADTSPKQAWTVGDLVKPRIKKPSCITPPSGQRCKRRNSEDYPPCCSGYICTLIPSTQTPQGHQYFMFRCAAN